MTRIEFEAEIPLIEKKGGIIQFPEIWVDTGGDGKTKVVTWISGNLSSVHFMIWRKNTQVNKSTKFTNRSTECLVKILDKHTLANNKSQNTIISTSGHWKYTKATAMIQSLYCESQLFYGHTHHTLLTLAIGIPHISHFLDITSSCKSTSKST